MATVEVDQIGALIDERVAPLHRAIADLQTASASHQEALAAMGNRQRKILEQHSVLNDLQQKQQLAVAALDSKVTEITATLAAMEEFQRTMMASLPGEGKAGGRLVGSKELMPTPLGEDYKKEWRVWSRKARSCLSRVDWSREGKLRKMLVKLERQDEPLKPEQIDTVAFLPQRA